MHPRYVAVFLVTFSTSGFFPKRVEPLPSLPVPGGSADTSGS